MDQIGNAKSNAVVEAELRLPSSKTLLPLFGTEVTFASAEITETTHGFSSYEITVQTSTRSLVDNLLKDASASGTPRMRLRLGLTNPGAAPTWLPWQELIIRVPVAKIIGLGAAAGYYAVISCADRLWEIDRVNRVLSRKGKISDIVQSIADFYGIPAIIEPTAYEGIWVQSFISDYDFLLNRMLPRALNAKGRGNYKFFMRDGVLHFHTIDYQTEVKQFNYYASSGQNLKYADYSQQHLDAGSAGIRFVVSDPYSGDRKELVSQPESTLRLSNAVPDFSGVKGAERNIMYHVGSNRVSEALALTNSVYEAVKATNYQVNLDLHKSLFFRSGDLCNLTVNPSNSQTTPSSGLYYVPSVGYIVEKNSVVARVVFERGEFFSSQADQTPLAQLGENVLTPQNAAPGQTVNVADIKSSNVTKGAGKDSSRVITLDAHDPNTA